MGAATRIAVNAAFMAGLAAMAVPEVAACPIGIEADRGFSWWSSWHVRMREPRPPSPDKPAALREPRVAMTITRVETLGDHDQRVAERLVRRCELELARCYQQLFLGEPIRTGTVDVTFRIAPDGTTTNVAATGPAAACVTAVIDALVLPGRGDDGTYVRAVLAFGERAKP